MSSVLRVNVLSEQICPATGSENLDNLVFLCINRHENTTLSWSYKELIGYIIAEPHFPYL